MDEVIRDLVVLGLIALVCFAGAVEYVYWRFGFDKMLERLDCIERHTLGMRTIMVGTFDALKGRKVA